MTAAPESGAERIVQVVQTITAQQLGGRHAGEVGADELFLDLGADSLLMVHLLRELERSFAVRVPMSELFGAANTPRRLGRLVASHLAPGRAVQDVTAESGEHRGAGSGRSSPSRLSEDLEFWRRRLGGALPALRLAPGRPRPAAPPTSGAADLVHVLPAELSDQVRDLSTRRCVTPFVTLLAAFAATLHRSTGQHDILFGVRVPDPEFIEATARPANTVLLRCDLSGDPRFDELLERVRDTALDAFEHRDLPFGELVRALDPPPDPGRHPFCQVLVVDATVPAPIEPPEVMFDLCVFLANRPEGIRCHIRYREERVDAATVRRLAGTLEGVLAHAVDASTPGHDWDEVVAVRAPASRSQADLWHRHHTTPEPSVHMVGARITIVGPLDATALARALSLLASRHIALRTRFAWHDGQLMQEAVPDAPVPMTFWDLSELSEPRRHDAFRERCRGEFRDSFAMDRAPLFRARLGRLAADRWILLLVFHHAIVDGGAIGVLLDDLGVAYDALLGGMVPSLAPVVRSPFDHADWQRAVLGGPRGVELVSFWRAALAGAPLHLELPYDSPRSTRLSGRGANHTFGIPAEVTDAVRVCARRLDTTGYVVTLAAFGLLLSRLSGQDDLVIPTSFANRGRPDHEAVVGVVMERLPLRVRPAGATTFRDLVATLTAGYLAAVDHADLPLPSLIESLPAGQRPTDPYPEVLFTMLTAPPEPPRLSGLHTTLDGEATGDTARMVLYCLIQQTTSGWRGGFEYSTDLFTRDTIARWADGFVALLTEVAADPELPLDAAAETVAPSRPPR